MCAKLLVTLLELCKHEVRCGEVGNRIIIHLRDAPRDETAEGAVVRLPDFVRFGVESGVRLRERSFQPSSEPKAIALNFQLKAPFLPVRFGEVKAKIGRPRGIGHKALRNCDVTGRRWVGM